MGQAVRPHDLTWNGRRGICRVTVGFVFDTTGDRWPFWIIPEVTGEGPVFCEKVGVFPSVFKTEVTSGSLCEVLWSGACWRVRGRLVTPLYSSALPPSSSIGFPLT